MGQPIDLSVCMIVRNEAHQLEAALRNFRLFADELVVVDTGSTDGTRAIAEKYADVVSDYAWHDDFSAARNVSLAKARGRYLLWLDADDRVDHENVQKIRRLKTLFDGRAYCFVLQDIQRGKPNRALLQLRCVPNVVGIKFQNAVHETLYEAVEKLGIGIVDTDIVIEHHGYANPYHLKSKIERNLCILKKIEKSHPENKVDVSLLYYMSNYFHTLGNYDEALKYMTRVLYILKKNRVSAHEHHISLLDYYIHDGLLFCAEIHVHQKRLREAEKYLFQLSAFPYIHPYVLFRMGTLAQRLNRHEEALGYFRRVDLACQPVTRLPWPQIDVPALVSRQAYSVFHLGGVEACSQWVEALKDEKVRYEVWENLGILAVENEKWDLAFMAFHRDLGAYRLSSLGWARYGSLMKRLEKFDLAVNAFQQALIEDPNNIEATIKLANMYWQMGADHRALKFFETLVTKGVDDPSVVKAYEILRKGSGFGIGTLAERDRTCTGRASILS